MDNALHRAMKLTRNLFFPVGDGFGIYAVPKVASTSIRHAVLHARGGALGEHDILRHPLLKKRWTAEGARQRGFFIATFVRNPFDRMVSVWSEKICRKGELTERFRLLGFKKPMPFTEFVAHATGVMNQDVHLLQQTSLIMRTGVMQADFIGRYERLEEDWKRVRALCPSLPPLPHAHASRHAHWRSIYTKEARKMVETMYQKDLLTFGYSFDESA